MARIVDYEHVLERLTAQGLVCHYHNSGAFGFPPGAKFEVEGWIGGEDPTIRPEMREKTKIIPPPYPENLARMAVEVWGRLAGDGEAWLMPMSHWAYELQFGSAGWLPELLRSVGVDPGELDSRNNGSAIAFTPAAPAERADCGRFIAGLLSNLSASDFMLALPGRPALCMIHHHKQLWWMLRDREALASALAELLPG